MAKRICGATDRLDQAGLLGSCRCVWRAAPSPATRILPEILQRGSHALIAEQGRTNSAGGPDRWRHHCQAAPGRIASSVRPDLISGRDRVPEELTSSIERYLEIHRPILARGNTGSNALWMAMDGKPMSYSAPPA